MSSYCATSPTSSAPWGRSCSKTSSTESTMNVMRGMPGTFTGARGAPLVATGLWNVDSSTRLWPSGVRRNAMSARTPSSPMSWSAHLPSTVVSPSSSRPSWMKNATAASRSSTTTPTWSIRLIVTVFCSLVAWPTLHVQRSCRRVLDSGAAITSAASLAYRENVTRDWGQRMDSRTSADTPLRVVIADDDAFARRVITLALRARGMTVVAEAKDGREAVRSTLIHRPDLVVLDVVMPGLDGILATREILDAEPGLRVVVLTGACEDALGIQALRAGAIAVVPDDAGVDALARAVEGAGRGKWAIARAAG